ncbi:MAG TPA: DUF3618 domain-containing protein [Actinopolymorphaceae bacterium]
MSDHRSSVPTSYAPDDRSPAQIEKDLADTRNRLASTVDSLVDQLHPKRILERRLESIKGRFSKPDGSIDIAKIAPVAIGVVVAVSGMVGLRMLVRGHSRS